MTDRMMVLLVAGLLAMEACGGDAAAPAGTPKAAATAKSATSAKPAGGKATASDTAAGPQDSTQLQREVFAYRGAGRDPFLSLLKSAQSRPLVTDVRVAGITYDASYPARSVAVLRDTAQHNKRYAVRVGDELGRMKVTEIRDDAVVVTVDEFGAERQVVLPVRRSRQQEETP